MVKILKEEYKPQFYVGTSSIAENRRKYLNPEFKPEKLRTLSDEDLTRLLGHREPGEAYKTVHPPLEEMVEPECPIRSIVEPTPGTKAGDRIRFFQHTDSVYYAPVPPYVRAWAYMRRYRGVDVGVLSGRAPCEMRERDAEKVSKELLENETFDPARTSLRGCTVHGHALRLDENGLMFDALRRYSFDKKTGNVVYIKDQLAHPLAEPIPIGKPLPEEELRKRTAIYRVDGVSVRKDPEVIKLVQRIHRLRSMCGFMPEKIKGD